MRVWIELEVEAPSVSEGVSYVLTVLHEELRESVPVLSVNARRDEP